MTIQASLQNLQTQIAAALGKLQSDKLDASVYAAADVLSKLLTVDGAGSGLNADLLDGMHAGEFATAAQGAKADSAVQPGDLGTAAAKDAPATGNATAAQVVLGSDTRLSDARTPTAHTHAIAEVTGLQAALDGKLATTGTAADAAKLGGMDAAQYITTADTIDCGVL